MAAGHPSLTDSILFAAVEIADADDRTAYLKQACGNDAALRREVDQLIENHFRAGRFLEYPGVANVPQPRNDLAGTQIGRYKLLEQIGEGGMGIVYMAEQVETVRRKVALKIIKPGMDTRQVVGRFEAERQALAMMDHPNIARVLDGGETRDGRPYFVMELVRGMPITDYCDQIQLSARDRLRLLITVCQAVQHAHQKGVIHRDLKPTNVLVTLHDGTPVPKVIDFGIAKAIGQNLTDKTLFTGFSQVVGTPLYMSPEQAEMSGLDVDTRCDVYSLGVLSYELLTGRTPFDKDEFKKAGLDELRRIIREVEPLRPSHLVSTLKADEGSTVSQRRGFDQRQLVRVLNGELDWIVMKALEKDRNQRYESVSAFAADIQRYLDNEPVIASPPSTIYRFRKFARRRRALLGVISVVAASVLLVMGVSVAAAWRLSERADQLDALRHTLAGERDCLEEVLLRVVAQNTLSDALHEPAVNQDYQTRARLATEALETAPKSPTLHLLAANALDDAMRSVELDPELNPRARERLVNEFSHQLAAVLASWKVLDERMSPGLVNSLAWMLLTATPTELRDGQKALALATELCNRYPAHAPYLNTLALASFRAGKYREAIDAENLALAQQDQRLGDQWPYIILAMSYARLGQIEDAARSLEIAERSMANRRGHWSVKLLFSEAKQLLDPTSLRGDAVDSR